MNAILGLGPVALMVGSLLDLAGEDYIFWARRSERSRDVAEQLASLGVSISALGLCPQLHGHVVRGAVQDFQATLQPVNTLYLCIPHTEYYSVLNGLPTGLFERVILLNSGLGSSLEVVSAIEPETPVFTFSNFFGAAKFKGKNLHLKALKKRVYLWGEEPLSLADQLPKIGVEVQRTRTGLEAEIRNITLYAHTTFGLAPHTLETVFGLTDVPRYLYKIYPEGPVERDRTKLYAQFFEDVMTVAEKLGAEKYNLLDFLQHQNYPVLSCFLTDQDVDNYPGLTLAQKGDLLFARYCGLLVDPKSKPNEEGRFFDFSAVPIVPAVVKSEKLTLPRTQTEELYHLQLLREMAQRLDLKLESLDTIWSDFQVLQKRLKPPMARALSSLVSSQSRRAKAVASAMKVPT